MAKLARFSISIEKSLLNRLEKLVKKSGSNNRSEFVCDLIRDRLVEQEWRGEGEVVGTITLVYDHERRELSGKLTHFQHHHHDVILTTTHVHLDEHICAEMILVKGQAARIREICDGMRRQKGVLHAALSLSSTGKRLA